MVQELSVCWCWNVFRRIFYFKKWESIRVLQVNFGTLDLYRWKFVQAMSNNGAYWSEFVNILYIDMQYHESLYINITDKHNDDSMFGSVAACILSTVKVCAIVFCYFSFIYLLFL